MQKSVKIIIVLVVIIGGYFLNNNLKIQKELQKNTVQETIPTVEISSVPTIASTNQVSQQSIFVPYWALNTELDKNYNKIIYFGISAKSSGIDKSDPGYKNLSKFQEFSSDKTSYLTLRMLNTEENLKILENKNAQQKVLNETMSLAKEYGFEGVVLDLELSLIPVTDVKKDVNTFAQSFETEAKKNNLKTAVTIYGDVFFRARPFDVEFIGKNTDEIMIMAYDYSKSYGEPGPNFPLQGREEFGYDFQTMIEQYSKVVPAEKLTVIFGMYGYDWTLGDQGKPLKRAEAITLNEANSTIISTCKYKNCSAKQDSKSKESQAFYTDDEGNNHEVWFETEDSVEAKKQFLQQKGITNVSFWAHSYF